MTRHSAQRQQQDNQVSTDSPAPSADCAGRPTASIRRPGPSRCIAGRASRRVRSSSRCAHIIGVVVSETTIETRMAVESVIANSRKSRPTMPPISRIGMKTAISEMLIEKTVKPISLRAFQRRCKRLHAVFNVPRDVLHHHDGVVHHETARDGQRHQREVVEAVAAQVHHRERADQRNRNRDRRDKRGPRRCAERETPRRSPGRSR